MNVYLEFPDIHKSKGPEIFKLSIEVRLFSKMDLNFVLESNSLFLNALLNTSIELICITT